MLELGSCSQQRFHNRWTTMSTNIQTQFKDGAMKHHKHPNCKELYCTSWSSSVAILLDLGMSFQMRLPECWPQEYTRTMGKAKGPYTRPPPPKPVMFVAPLRCLPATSGWKCSRSVQRCRQRPMINAVQSCAIHPRTRSPLM